MTASAATAQRANAWIARVIVHRIWPSIPRPLTTSSRSLLAQYSKVSALVCLRVALRDVEPGSQPSVGHGMSVWPLLAYECMGHSLER